MPTGIYKRSAKTKKIMSFNASKRTGKNNNNFKGDRACYTAKHMWISQYYGKPNMCEHCLRTDKKKYEWALKNHKICTRKREDYIRLCTTCHRLYDIEFNNYVVGFNKAKKTK